MAALHPADPRHAALRRDVICLCTAVARREAHRYRNTGEALDDLVQVASLGLVLAVDRFDPARGVRFKYFALPTITGELKRHFRDKSWTVKVTRRMQELYSEIRRAQPLLAQQLGRTPTTADLAAYLDLSEDDVALGRRGEAVYATRSLNFPATYGGDDGVELGDSFGGPDPAIEAFADHDALLRAWPALSERLQVILSLRFVDELSQVQIADKMGISQMHVSRLINRSLGILRRRMLADLAPPGPR